LIDLELPQDYGSFNEFYSKAISFKSFLLKDGYSEDLRKDFVEYYNSLTAASEIRNTLTTTRFGEEDAWAFGEKGPYGSEYSLPEAGLYDIFIEKNFGDFASAEWNIQFTLNEKLQEIDEEFAKNVFFELPFDGEVGILNEGGKTRQGYGISFSNSPEQADMYLTYKTDQENANLFDSTGGEQKLSVEFGETFDKTNSGLILKVDLDKGEFTYNPSVATPIEIELGTSRGTEIEGMLYELSGTEQGILRSQDSIFTFRSDAKNFLDQIYPPSAGMNLCREVGTFELNLHGFQQQLVGQKTFKGIAFVPFARQYTVVFYCSQGAAKVTSLDTDETINVGQGYRTGELDLKLHEPVEAKKVTLPSFLNKIEEEQVCIKTGQDSIELLWNKEKLLSG